MKAILLLLLSIGANLGFSQQINFSNIEARECISLDGKWDYIVDWYSQGYWYKFYEDQIPKDKTERIEYSFDLADKIEVPGDWNSQKPELKYYEGTVWYRKKFELTKNKDKKYFIHFGAVNYIATVFVNGKEIGKHEGGFTPFAFEITDNVTEGENTLIVAVYNRRGKDYIPTLNTDWWHYGGISRDVSLIETNNVFIKSYTIKLDKENNKRINYHLQLNNLDANKKALIKIEELGVSEQVIIEKGIASGAFEVENIEYWSPNNPKLYSVTLEMDNSEINENIGFKTIKTEGQKIMLNGKSIFLKGICIHEENPIREGRAFSEEDAKMLLGWAKELGCNYVRLAHYPHNEYMVKLADKMGLMVWSEIPVYWGINWENEASYKNAESQLTEMIGRDQNRASIIIWSMANETRVEESRTLFISNLIKKAKELDNTRLVSAALLLNEDKSTETKIYIDDPLGKYTDILAVNEYYGWYNGLPNVLDEIEYEISYTDRPLVFSEFGAGALYGYHGDSLTRWTEEYQSYLYKETLEMIDRTPQVQGFTPWVLVDFKSPRRYLPIIQDFWNRKGLISNRGLKKEAFYILQEYYNNKN